MRLLNIYCFLTLAIAMPAVAQAGEPERVLTLGECVDSALSLNAAVRAADMEVARARILKGTAFNPPMTEITLKQETTGGGGPENGVYFGQEFDFPTLYVARNRSLASQESLAGSRRDALAREVVRDVSLSYFSMLYTQELLELNSSLGAIYDDFCRVAAVRLREGEGGALELMNAERVREKNDMERRGFRVQYDTQAAELTRLTGLQFDTAPVLAPDSVSWIGDAGGDVALAARVRVAERELEVAEREIAVARQELLPGIRLGATVQALIRSFNPYHVERLPFDKGNFMGFEVGVTVPLFSGAQSARLKAARADREIARLNLEQSRSDIEAEREKALATLRAAEEKMEYYRSTALPRADEICRIARVSYELGDIDYVEYISNIETAYGVYRDYAECRYDYNRAVILINSLQ